MEIVLYSLGSYTTLLYSMRMQQADLFAETIPKSRNDTADFFLPDSNRPLAVDPRLADLFELSVDAFYTAIHARMSEFPIEKEISRFIEKAGKAGNRAAAARAALDRGDPDVLTVLKAAYKVQHEIHRLMGLLRFSPGPDGVYTARCSPDHFILPALADHFCLRFGETPWAIIDEKRNLCLYRDKGADVRLVSTAANSSAAAEITALENNDTWEDLWRLYHRSVNNESKKNQRLQHQFMPERYRGYLPEMK